MRNLTKKSYSTAKTYLENVDPATRRCDEHLNIEDHESKVDGFFYIIYDYKIPKENIYLKSLVYQHAHIPNLALILCMDNAEGVCRWRFVNTLLEKCSKRCYSGRAEIEYCPARDLSNFEYPYNNRRQLSLVPVLYQISRHKCWLPGGKTHYGCKCDLNGHKICERNLLLYETIWNRCDQNCKSSPDCPNLVFAYCCSKDSQKRSCPPKMKNAAGPSHKYIYPVFWSEWSRCTEANGYDCRHCINAEHNNRKCGDNIRRRTVGYFNDRDKHTMRDLEGEYPMPQYEAHVNPAAYLVPIILLVVIIAASIGVCKTYKKRRNSSTRHGDRHGDAVFNIPAAYITPPDRINGFQLERINKATFDAVDGPKPKPRSNLSKSDISLPVLQENAHVEHDNSRTYI